LTGIYESSLTIVDQRLPQIVFCEGISNEQEDLLDFQGRDFFRRMHTFATEDKVMIQQRLSQMWGDADDFNTVVKQIVSNARGVF